jgi:asparagine synthase (glutamine-hydrolysing)
MFAGVCELPPGHALTLQDGRVSVECYWEPDYNPDPREARPEQDYVDELWELLVDATRLRLRADVPVGTYLSGGLDSSVITAIVKKLSGTPVRSFSVSFDDPEFDESLYQNEVIRHLGTDHQRLHCEASDVAHDFPEVIWHAEKPVLRTAPVPLFRLSKLARASGYKVVLTGEGSDEVLGGYDIFKEAKIRAFWGMQPGSHLRPRLLGKLYPYLPSLQSQPEPYRRAFFHVAPDDLENAYFSHLPRWEMTSKLSCFLADGVLDAIRAYDPRAELSKSLPQRYGSWDCFCRAQCLEAMLLLPGYILSSQGDRVAMAHSVEARMPFLDHRVVEFASRLPVTLKMKVLNEKYILKRCVGDLLPVSVRKRPKQPYRAPEAKSFFQPASPDYVGELLSSERIRRDGIFDVGAVQSLTGKFRQGRAIGIKDNMALVGILSTQLVIDRFLRGFPGSVRKENYATAAAAAPICR